MRISDLRNNEFQRILLIKPSAVGDVIHVIPVLDRLRMRYPNAQIDWMLTPHNAELVRNHPALSNVVLFERQAYGKPWKDWSAPAGLVKMFADLRSANYDLVIDLHGQFRSAMFALATAAPTRIGFDRPRKRVRKLGRQLTEDTFDHAWQGAREGSWIVYTHRIPIPTLDAHAIDRYLWLSELLGLPDSTPRFDLRIDESAREKAAGLLESSGLSGGPLLLLAPGTVWETKHWIPSHFAEVGRQFRSEGWSVGLIGAGRDRMVCAQIKTALPEAVDLAGKTSLPELAELIRRARLCVTNDSGPMHLAAALGTPVVAIFGPTDPVWVGPYGQPDSVVRVDLPCSPCYLRKLRDCPFNHQCMREVTPGMVIDRARQILAKSEKEVPIQG
jgi:heptosyltransferase-1